MNGARLLAADGAKGYYHCVSRVVDRRFVFGDVEREFFVKTLRKLEVFCGIKILTYCVMSNHYHVLLEVPDTGQPVTDMTDDELLNRVGKLYGKLRRGEVEQMLGWAREKKDERWEAEIKGQFLVNMGRLPVFMKMLKQRFTMWYNRQHGRKGTLWEERYKSLLVQGDASSLLAVAAYIDLNPVRAEMVSDPKDYRWSGYGAAVGGVTDARRGLGRILQLDGESSHWKHVGCVYRKYVYQATESQVGSKSAVAGVIEPEKIKEVVKQGGKLPLADVLRVKVRYFSDGMVLGSKEFVDEVFEGNRQRFGEKRTSGARRMRGGDWGDLRVMRDLRVDVVGKDER